MAHTIHAKYTFIACVHRYIGTNCETECSDTTWGQDCANQCTCVAANTADCDNVDGTCTCKADFTGPTCSCSAANTASVGADGTCSCGPGFTGDNCTDPCSDTTYGAVSGSSFFLIYIVATVWIYTV